MTVDMLPPEVLALALDGARPIIGPDMWAPRLTALAENDDYPAWVEIGQVFRYRPLFLRRHKWLAGASLRHAREVGGPALAVGRVKRGDSTRPGWYVVIDGRALHANGRALLFSTPRRAQQAASLAALAHCTQRVLAMVPGIWPQLVELAELSDQPDTAKPHVAPRERVFWAEADDEDSPLYAFTAALADLYGATRRLDEGDLPQTVGVPIGPGELTDVQAAATAQLIDRVLVGMDACLAAHYRRTAARRRSPATR